MHNKIILGTAQMGMDYGINNNNGKINLFETFEILNEANRQNICLLDTAPVYGDIHQIIGEFHKKNKNKIFKIITKIPIGINFANLEQVVKGYINDLAVNQIEVLLFHSIDTYLSSRNDSFYLKNLKNLGLVKYFGVSVYNNNEVEEIINDSLIDIVQIPFNLLDNINFRGDILMKIKNSGKIAHTRSVFLQGLFFKNNINIDVELERNVQIIKSIANNYNISIELLALQYCIFQNNIDKVIIGVDSKFHLKKNIDATKNILNKKIFEEIDCLKIINKDLLNPTLWNKK